LIQPAGGTDPVRHEVTVPVTVADAFDVFTAELVRWWPREFTWSQDGLVDIRIDPEQDGACYEIGPHGFRCDWGRVLQWDPPHRVVISWQITPDRVPEPDPSRASEVEVSFESVNSRPSRVVLEHRAFERHGRGAPEYRAGMERGWAYLLDRYARAVHSRGA
jgi:uncharacterized protein YndB with AHSA1/START domain